MTWSGSSFVPPKITPLSALSTFPRKDQGIRITQFWKTIVLIHPEVEGTAYSARISGRRVYARFNSSAVPCKKPTTKETTIFSIRRDHISRIAIIAFPFHAPPRPFRYLHSPTLPLSRLENFSRRCERALSQNWVSKQS